MGKAESQRNLDRWTDQKWRTSDGKPVSYTHLTLPTKA